MRTIICALCWLMLSTSSAPASTWYVHPDGSGDAATIQAAIDAAAGGDIIELANGIFTGPGNRDIDPVGKAVTIRSQSGDPDSCVIDCQGSVSSPHRAFRFHSGESSTTVLSGLTITNGYASSHGGGVSCTSNSAPLISGCILINNAAGQTGGALYCTSSSNLTLDNCQFLDNIAEIYGGAIRCYQSSPTLIACLFRGNIGPFGAGFSCYRNCQPALTDCRFESNESAHGGGMFSFDSAAVLTRCTFVDNLSLGEGGGFANFDSSPTVIDCEFTNNTAGEAGGGFYAGGDGSGAISGSTFTGNTSPRGGGIYTQFTDVTVSDCTLVSNSAEVVGSGVYVAYAQAELERVIVAFGEGAAAVACADAEDIPVLVCCDIYGNADGDWVDCIADQLGADGNIAADPLFCDPAAGDFTLRDDSPCAAENSSGCGLIGAWPIACASPTHADGAPATVRPVLLQNHPNPFNPSTVVGYRLPIPAVVTLQIFDLHGRAVRILEKDVARSEGLHRVRWDGRDDRGQLLSSGAYFYRLSAGGRTQTRTMLLVR